MVFEKVQESKKRFSRLVTIWVREASPHAWCRRLSKDYEVLPRCFASGLLCKHWRGCAALLKP